MEGEGGSELSGTTLLFIHLGLSRDVLQGSDWAGLCLEHLQGTEAPPQLPDSVCSAQDGN